MDGRRLPGIDVFKFSDDRGPGPVISEMSIAENNFKVVLDTAEEMIGRSLLFHDLENPSAMIQPLRDLVGQITHVFSFIRRDLKSKYPTANLGAGRVAPAGHPKPIIGPNGFSTQRTLCPLVLFFRIIAQGLSAYRIKVSENSWGPIRPLHDLLLRLQDRIRNQMAGNFWPGLSTCIMFHEYDSTFTIASSTPQYRSLRGLSSLSKTIRKDHITRLRARVDPRDRAKINNVEKLCKEVSKDRSQNAFENSANRAQVDGIGATFNPGGEYMAACFLDFWRFNMPRPAGTQAREGATKLEDRPVYGVDSCAEWELWMIGISKLKIMPGAILRNHPLIEMRETFPPRTQTAKPPSRLDQSNPAAHQPGGWKPPPILFHRTGEKSHIR